MAQEAILRKGIALALIAQLVEHLTCNEGVVGSSPIKSFCLGYYQGWYLTVCVNRVTSITDTSCKIVRANNIRILLLFTFDFVVIRMKRRINFQQNVRSSA